MKIAVLIKQVPDTWDERLLSLETGILDRDAGNTVIDEITERALEIALQFKDRNRSCEVVVVTMGPEDASNALRKALSMGADRAVHVLDEQLQAADAARTARVITAALRRESFDLVLAGNESTDGRGGVVPTMVGELLGIASATSLDDIEISESDVSGSQLSEYGQKRITVSLPSVISVTERTDEPRFPSFKGIMTAKRKPLSTVSVADLGSVPESGAAKGRMDIVSVSGRSGRDRGTKIVDDGNAAAALVDYLITERMI